MANLGLLVLDESKTSVKVLDYFTIATNDAFWFIPTKIIMRSDKIKDTEIGFIIGKFKTLFEVYFKNRGIPWWYWRRGERQTSLLFINFLTFRTL